MSLAWKNNKDNDNLSDEHKVILYNEFFKKHLFKKIRILSLRLQDTLNQKHPFGVRVGQH